MSSEFSPRHLDVRVFAQAQGQLSGPSPFEGFARLMDEAGAAGAGRQVDWVAQGEQPVDVSGASQTWLHLRAHATVPLTCQRCLEPVAIELNVERSFRFVATEAQAEQEDELSEEDVLVWSRDFDLLGLVEDELLMELPLVPRHDRCPGEVRLEAQDDAFEEASRERPQPFAALARLKTPGSGHGSA